MLGSAFYRNRAADFGGDMPPADWCVATLHTLTNKYEHLTSGRKANPPFAEAVLNSFKSKLLNVVSTHALYESEDSSDVESEWPLGSDAAPYMDMKGDEYSTSNYLSADTASSDCFSEHVSDASLLSSAEVSDSSDLTLMPPNIEEALMRFLGNNSSQVLSETFTTFAASGDAVSTAKCHDDDAGDVQYDTDSGSCSPESLDEPSEYLAGSDPVDIFVQGFSANGRWEEVPHLQPADGSLTPCKRKRNTDKEDKQAEEKAAGPRPLPRSTVPVSPRKRSRSVSRETAAVVSEQTPAAAA
ncbi:hypothetical protein IW137_002020 [Coemansia sp. RSA 1287]|nr:hypothetical protein LPJ58_003628 [Coemansia sp. RSA 1591]KAJ1759969.1 hypothetical protein LPJ69_003580 [Coemansia sp. RSA 1752]KAJ1786568.1 hypothetical protein LPJ67_003531 [Coemansia sp. RSA 1938]KAJ2255041.1 hypothetical protein GGH98_002135 [Coemansia sp. RSA 454]KAJ2265549.1 hypothetical protein J3F81_005800 [Coemansia sp. RSA 371]KAJ2268254.1 hypothetical protein GGH14_005815 [Coemansia sp. RSA 370]KAJ2549513.1 hypothetical protein IWW35_003714 [Coemansia sp. RSA 1878]KAJ2644669.1